MDDGAAAPNDKRQAWVRDIPGAKANLTPKGQSAGVALLAANRGKLETVHAEALVRMGRLTSLEASSRDAIEAVRTRLMAASGEYDRAYQSYARVLQAAKQQAGEQQAYTDVVVGLAIGILVGVTIEAVPALLAVEAAAAGVKAAIEAMPKQRAEAALGALAKKAAVAGLDPGVMRPDILRLGIWRLLTQLHEAAPKIGAHGVTQALLVSAAEYALGEATAQGGMSEADAADLVLAISLSDAGSKEVDGKLDAAEAKIAALRQAGSVESAYTATQMEVDIWQLWIGSLATDSSVLSIGAIEDYLGPRGFGHGGLRDLHIRQ